MSMSCWINATDKENVRHEWQHGETKKTVLASKNCPILTTEGQHWEQRYSQNRVTMNGKVVWSEVSICICCHALSYGFPIYVNFPKSPALQLLLHNLLNSYHHMGCTSPKLLIWTPTISTWPAAYENTDKQVTLLNRACLLLACLSL